MNNNKKIGFIGGGNISRAIINGILKSGILKPENIIMYDRNEDKRKAFENDGITVKQNENEVSIDCDYLFLTVKPQNYDEVLEKIKSSVNENTVIVTVAPGISIAYIQSFLGENFKVIRTMPNTPALVGEGVTAYAFCKNYIEEEKEFSRTLLNSFSSAYELTEDKMDAVISVSGSSPAYVYMFINAIAKSAEEQGIDYEKALEMAAKTVIGGAKLLLNSADSPEELIKKVCSKGGTTIKAVEHLKDSNFDEIINGAMLKCTERAVEMRK